MKEELIVFLNSVKQYNAKVLDTISKDGVEVNTVQVLLKEIPELIKGIYTEFPKGIYAECEEFFKSFYNFLIKCENAEFVVTNINMLGSSLELFDECIMLMTENCNTRFKICVCCGNEVVYEPMPAYYDEMEKAMGVLEGIISETLNKTEYTCPVCSASDRDRLIVSFMKKLELDKAVCGESLLQVAPAVSIEHWVHGNCPSITYHSTDLYMDNVTFKSDIQNMNQIADCSYDYWICSHVLGHVQDDRKAMRELYRILKDNGFGMFLVPIAIGVDTIDEEWGLSEVENWKRFGQGDHCRRYGRKGLVERMEESGFTVHLLGKEFFGEALFNECGLTDTSILYVLTKKDSDINELINDRIEMRKKQEKPNPLVSVILPTYNHVEYVAEAVESVLNQTYKNIELLVADDCSTDGTVEVLKQYKDKVSELHLFEKNTNGLTFDFLSGRAKGKYIAVMHSDDAWALDKLEMQVAYMESHPECGACFTGCSCINENGEHAEINVFLEANKKKEQWVRYFFDNCNCFAHPSILIAREVYIDLCNNSANHMFNQLPDYWMWLNLLLNKEVHIIERKLTFFRFHESGERKNTSARTRDNQLCHLVEETYIWYELFKRMSNEFFLNAFKDLLTNTEANTEEEILCEKMFVLLKHRINYIKNAGIYFWYDICQKPGMMKFMEERYNWTRRDIKKIAIKLFE